MKRNTGIRAALAALLAVCTHSVAAQTVLQRVERDEIAMVAKDDPDMAAAMRKARASLPQFLALARAPRTTITSMAVKVAVRENDEAEYFWITGFREEGGRFSGRISNTPRMVKGVKEGDTIRFSREEIVNWLYREAGKMHGNYTACALIKREPKKDAEAFMKRYGLTCDP